MLPSLTSVEKSHNGCAQRGASGEEGSVPAGQDSVPTVFDTGGPAQSGSTQATARWQAAASRLAPYARMSQNGLGGEDHDLERPTLKISRTRKPFFGNCVRLVRTHEKESYLLRTSKRQRLPVVILPP